MRKSKFARIQKAKPLFLYDRKMEGHTAIPRSMTKTQRAMEKAPVQSEDCVG
jgi:hypothetical protein